ncbi:glycosyltransferase [Aquimarina rhabdastrellae]
MNSKTTGIIIPCYNEAERLPIEEFKKFISTYNSYYLCFVNDGSSDRTGELLNLLERQHPKKIKALHLEVNQGKAAAVRAGAHYFNNFSYIDNIAFIDADLSTSLTELDSLVSKLNKDTKLSMIFGSRKGEDAGQIERSLMRKVFSGIVGFVIKSILGLPIQDTQCGAKVFKKEIVPEVYTQSFLSRWLFDVEIFLRLKNHLGSHKLVQSIREEPLENWVEVDGSKLSFKDSLLIPLNLLVIWLAYFKIQFNHWTVSDIYSLKTNYFMVQ